VEEFRRLRAAVGWGEVDDDGVAVALQGSLYACVVEHDGTAVACGRIVGDGGLYFYVQDVMVLPEFQGRGMGASVMDAVTRYLEGAAAGGAFVGLMAAEGSERFYERYGFRRRPDDRPGMYRVFQHASVGSEEWRHRVGPGATLASYVRVGSVVIDCNDFPRMLAFWQEALRYGPRDPPEGDWAVLRDPNGRNVNVSLQLVPEPRVGKNRLHFDLYTDDRDGEVERLLGIGATIHPRTPEPDEDFIVLADPEGNLFCVIQKDD